MYHACNNYVFLLQMETTLKNEQKIRFDINLYKAFSEQLMQAIKNILPI